jgi:hypothetical protein
MLDRPSASPEEQRLPRLLPRDRRYLLATAECQRNLEAAIALLRQFRAAWFESDPPEVTLAQEISQNLLRVSDDIRNSSRELVHLISAKS